MRLPTTRLKRGIVITIAAALLFAPLYVPTGFWTEPSKQTVTNLTHGGIRNLGQVLNMEAQAADLLPAAIDFDSLLIIDDDEIEVRLDNSVARQTLSSAQVRKIGYGIETIVGIVRTPSGTYSMDGLRSPHIQYPGISVTRKPTEFTESAEHNTGTGWLQLPLNSTGSILRYGETLDGGKYITTGKKTCVLGDGYVVCS